MQVTDEFMDMLCKKYDDIIDKLECLAYKIPKDEAENIVRRMTPKGQYWTFNQAKEFAQNHGVTHDWYLVLNMVYNDYYDTAKTFELQNDPEFYFSLAKDFIDDPDARLRSIFLVSRNKKKAWATAQAFSIEVI